MNEAVLLVLEYMDGGSLADVVSLRRMAVGHIATVCREVRGLLVLGMAWMGSSFESDAN